MLFFILGILFCEVILPILDELVAVISTKMEKIKGKDTVEISKYNVAIQKLGIETEPTSSQVIGFTIPDEEYIEEEEDDE